jgi:SAM-dependent methyltransferase
VQITDRLSPEALFSDYIYFSSYSDSFLEHARRMAEDLARRLELGPSSRVIEVASNDGYLLQYFQRLGIPVLGVEPAQNVAARAEARGIPTLQRFFGPAAVDEVRSVFGEADLLVGNNVLAHVPEVQGFLAAARDCLREEGVAVFEFPWLRDLVDGLEFDTIYHEHVFYLSLSAVTALAATAGLECFDVVHQPVHGGSLRVFLARASTRHAAPAVAETLRAEEAAGLRTVERFADFGGKVREARVRLRDRLLALKADGRRLAAYGAPAKGNTLLNYCGIGRDILEFTVDRNPHKQGLLLPGSRLPILPPEELLRAQPDYTLLLPWNLAREIVAQQADYVARGGRFLVPLPDVREVTA